MQLGRVEEPPVLETVAYQVFLDLGQLECALPLKKHVKVVGTFDTETIRS